MRFSSFSLVFALPGLLLAAPADFPHATRAGEVLREWEAVSPVPGNRRMHIVYWTPADTEPAPAYRERLSRVMASVRDFYAREMSGYGFGARTIRLQTEADGLLRLPVVRGKKPFSAYSVESGREIREDCVAALKAAGVDADRETLVIFCNLSKWDPVKRTMVQTSPYYASGTHRDGTAWQVDSPLLDSALLGVRDRMLKDAQYGHISEGKYNSIFVGGVAHELGHALGLPHCRECPEVRKIRGHALMGDGNRHFGDALRGDGPGAFLSEGHAMKLAAHPQFSGSVKAMESEAGVDWPELKLESAAGGARITGRVRSKLPVHALLAYADPVGGADYDATLACAAPDAAGRFELGVRLNPETKSERGEIRLVAVCANGAATAYAIPVSPRTYPYRKNTDGSANLDAARVALELPGALAAWRAAPADFRPDPALSPATRAVLTRLALPDSTAGKPEPAGAAGDSLVLTDGAPASMQVGYGRVHFDRTPEGEPLTAAGEFRPCGLWAHADSVLTYRLDGRWKTFRGEAGQNDSGHGRIVLRLVGDGKELWHSGILAGKHANPFGKESAGVPKPFSIDVSGVKVLELHATGVDGKIGGAHAVWFDPVLSR